MPDGGIWPRDEFEDSCQKHMTMVSANRQSAIAGQI